MRSKLYSLTQSLHESLARGDDVSAELTRRNSQLVSQMWSDREVPQLLELWGRSSNCDETAGQTIVHPEILRTIGDLAGVSMRGRVVHAGLVHTYGYLLSNLETPYGFKRDRYVNAALSSILELRRDLLGPAPRAGSLFQNLTHALGRVVFPGDSRERRVLLRHSTPIDSVGDLDGLLESRRLRRTSVIERITHIDGVRVPALELHTDLFHSEEGTILVYSIRKSTRWGHRLVTAFPVADDYLEGADYDGPPRLRYNAYLRELVGRRSRGRRTITEHS